MAKKQQKTTTEAKPAQQTKPAEPPKPAIIVQAKSEPYRRANIAWSTTPRTIALDELSEDQLAAIKADPNLIVTDAAAE